MTLKVIRYPNRKLYLMADNPEGLKVRYTSLEELLDLVKRGYGIQGYCTRKKTEFTKELLTSILRIKQAQEVDNASISDLTSQLRSFVVAPSSV